MPGPINGNTPIPVGPSPPPGERSGRLEARTGTEMGHPTGHTVVPLGNYVTNQGGNYVTDTRPDLRTLRSIHGHRGVDTYRE